MHETPLHYALQKLGKSKLCFKVVKILVEAGDDVNAKDNEGCTSIFYWQSPESLRFLIEHGAKIDILNDCRKTALFSAVDCKSLDNVKILVEAGIDVNHMSGRRRPEGTVITDLCKYSHSQSSIEIANYLIDNGAIVENDDLIFASKGCIDTESREKSGRVNFVLFLMDKLNRNDGLGNSLLMYHIVYGGNENFDMESFVNVSNGCGLSPLMLAVRYREEEFVSRIIKYGADVNYINEDQSALSIACNYRDLNMIRLLIDAGADVNSPKNLPLKFACMYGNREIVEYLLENGAKVDEKVIEKACIYQDLEIIQLLGTEHLSLKCLIIACQFQSVDVVKYILKNGINPNQCDKHGNYPLGMACKHGTEEMVEAFLEMEGIDVNPKANVSPLTLACKWRDVSIVRRLLEMGARSEGDVDSPLWYACNRGELEIVETLLRNGFDPNNEERSSAHISDAAVEANKNSLEVVQLLIRYGANMWQRENALFEAVQHGKHSIVEYLADLGVSCDQPKVLRMALNNRDKRMVDFLVKHDVRLGQKTIYASRRRSRN